MSGRPRRKAAMKQGHIESGGEQFHLDQVKQMKRGTLLKNFSTFDEVEGVYHCRFLPNCSKTYKSGEMMSLSAHLLIHVRESTARAVKNPKFYENLIFHSVPKEKQFDIGNAFNENGEKVEPSGAPVDDQIPWYFRQLRLTRRTTRKTAKEMKTDETPPPPTQADFDAYDVYREWKEPFFLTDKILSISFQEFS